MRFRNRPRIEQLEDRLVPSTFTVTDPLDSLQANPGTDDPTDANGMVSLRSAIAAANFDASAGTSDTIEFDSSLAGATFTLTQGELELSGSGGTITIDGSALSTPVSISGGGISRVFMVDQDVQAAFDDFTITGGTDAGDGSDDYGGGGIENIGSLTADNVDFTANSATLDGGAISNFDSVSLTLIDCTFTGNSTAQFGGAIENYAPLTITNCSFTDNTALSEGGAIFNTGGPLAATGTSFTSNSAPFGGAVVNWSAQAEATMTGCTFENNSVYNSGGAIQDIYQAYLTVSSSTFSNNSAAFGGAIEVYEAAASLSNCTLSANSGSVSGGGIADYSSQVTADGCDFASNTAPQGSDINLGSSGALSVTAGKESLPDGLFASSGRVSVTGPGTELTLGGASAVSGCSLTAGNGATLNLPATITSFYGSLEATGDGSVLNLPGLTTWTLGTAATADSNLEAIDGGTVNLPALTSISDGLDQPFVFLTDTGNSTIDAPNLTYLQRAWVTLDGTDKQVADSWITFSHSVLMITGGSYDISGLNYAVGCDIWAQGGDLNLPSLTKYSTDGVDSIEALDGSVVELDALAAASTSASTSGHNGFATISASGIGSVVDLPGLMSVSGNVTISVSDSGDIEMNTLASTVSPSASSAPSGVPDPVTLQVVDVDGDPIKFTGLAVALTLGSTSGGQGTFSSVTDNRNGTYTATFTGTTEGVNTIDASINGASVPSSPTIQVIPGIGSASTSTLSVSAASVQSGDAIAVTLQAFDVNGNKVTSGGLDVAFGLASASGAKGTFSSVTDNGDGTYTATFTGTTEGANTIVATIDGKTVTSSVAAIDVTLGAVDPANSLIALSRSTIQLGGVTTIAIQTRDAAGNDETSGGLPVSLALSASSGARGKFSNVADDENGSYTATFTATADGSNSIVPTIVGTVLGSLAPTISVSGEAFSNAKSTLKLSSASVVSRSSIAVTLQAEDARGIKETAGGLAVAFELGSASGGQGTFSSVTDNGNGTYTATFTGTIAGVNTIRATMDGGKIASAPAIHVAPGSFNLGTSLVTVSAVTVKSGSTVAVTLHVKDDEGNDLAAGGLAVAFALTGGSGTGTFSAVKDNHNGTYTATFAGATQGVNSITASINGSPVTSSTAVTVTPGTGSASTSTLSLSAPSVQSSQEIEVMLQAFDLHGNKVTSGGLKVAFELARTSGARGTFGPVKDNGDGTYTATFTGTIAGNNAITATIGGVRLAAGSAQAIAVTAGSVNLAKSVVTLSAKNVSLGSQLTVELQPKDAYGNDVVLSGQTVVFSLGSAKGGQGTFSDATYDSSNGTYTATFTGTVKGANTIRAKFNGTYLTSTAPSISVT